MNNSETDHSCNKTNTLLGVLIVLLIFVILGGLFQHYTLVDESQNVNNNKPPTNNSTPTTPTDTNNTESMCNTEDDGPVDCIEQQLLDINSLIPQQIEISDDTISDIKSARVSMPDIDRDVLDQYEKDGPSTNWYNNTGESAGTKSTDSFDNNLPSVPNSNEQLTNEDKNFIVDMFL